MTDNRFESGPPPKKSKASSPTSSKTSLILTQEMDLLKRRQTQNELLSPASQAVSSFLQTHSGAPVAMGNIGATYNQAWEKNGKPGSNIKQEMTFDPFFSPGSVTMSSGLGSISQSTGSHMNDDLFGFESLSMPSLLSCEIKVDIKHEDITDDEMGTKSESKETRDTLNANPGGNVKTEFEVKIDVEKDLAVKFDCQTKTEVKPDSEVKMEFETDTTAEMKIKKDLDGGEQSVASVKLEQTADGLNPSPMVNTNQMSIEKLMGSEDKQKLLRILKGNPRLMAEFIKKVRQQEAFKHQQQSLMMPGASAQSVAMADSSMRNPMAPFSIQQQQPQPTGFGVTPGHAMMTANGDHGYPIQQSHQSPQQAPQVILPGIDGYQPGMMPCQQPYSGYVMPNHPSMNQEYVGNHVVNRMTFHQAPRHIHPQLLNHSLPRQPQSSVMNYGNYSLPQNMVANPGALQLQQMNDPSSVVCSLPSASPLSTSSPRPGSSSSSPHHLPPHYVNKVLPHSAEPGSVQRTGSVGLQLVASGSNVLCQDGTSVRQVLFSTNAKTSDMSNSTLSRPTELSDTLQQFSGANSYLHFLDRK